jgi:hypothetical protein
MPWISGLLFGLLLLLSELLIRRSGLDAIRVFRFVFQSVGFGIIYSLGMREYSRRVYYGLTNEEEWIFERLEGEECFRYRMPAALAIGPKRPVTGVLHLGRPGLFFVPNRKSAAKHRPIEMTPLDRIALCIVDPPPRTLRQKLFIPHPQRLLEFSSGGQSARFEVPLVDYTAERLTGFLSALQADEAES